MTGPARPLSTYRRAGSARLIGQWAQAHRAAGLSRCSGMQTANADALTASDLIAPGNPGFACYLATGDWG